MVASSARSCTSSSRHASRVLCRGVLRPTWRAHLVGPVHSSTTGVPAVCKVTCTFQNTLKPPQNQKAILSNSRCRPPQKKQHIRNTTTSIASRTTTTSNMPSVGLMLSGRLYAPIMRSLRGICAESESAQSVVCMQGHSEATLQTPRDTSEKTEGHRDMLPTALKQCGVIGTCCREPR